MIIFIYGEDSYRARHKLKEIIEEHKKIRKSGLNLKYIDCSRKDGSVLDEFKNNVRQTSMFQEKKLVAVFNPFSDKEFKEKFLEQAESFLSSKDIILLYEDKKIDGRDALFNFLKKKAKCQKFDLLAGKKLENWARNEFSSAKAKIEEGALQKIIGYVGSDLWRMSNEIRKLADFGAGKIIKEKDVALLVKPKIETDIFNTIDGLAQKNKSQAIRLIQRHLEKGDSASYLFSMINFQFRNLLAVKDLQERRNVFNVIVKKSGLHPFVAKKSYFQSQKFSLEELKKIYRKIYQADLDIKTGKINPEAALETLVAEI